MNGQKGFFTLLSRSYRRSGGQACAFQCVQRLCLSSQAAEKRPSVALPSFLIVAAYLHVRLTLRNLSAEGADSPPFGWVPGFGCLAFGRF